MSSSKYASSAHLSKGVSPNIPGAAWLWPFDSPGARKRREDPRCLFSLFVVRVTEHWHRLHRDVREAPSLSIFQICWPWSWQTSSTLPEQENSGTVLNAELSCFTKKRETAQGNTSLKSTTSSPPEYAGAVQNSCLYLPQDTCRPGK